MNGASRKASVSLKMYNLRYRSNRETLSNNINMTKVLNAYMFLKKCKSFKILSLLNWKKCFFIYISIKCAINIFVINGPLWCLCLVYVKTTCIYWRLNNEYAWLLNIQPFHIYRHSFIHSVFIYPFIQNLFICLFSIHSSIHLELIHALLKSSIHY